MNYGKRFMKIFVIAVLILMTQSNLGVQAQDIQPDVQTNAVTYQKISSGYQHVCAVSSTGKLVCWGSNAYGQLGSGNYQFEARSTPGSVVGLTGETVVDFVAGGYNTCMINSNGALKCWGDNNWKEMGNPAYTRWAYGEPVQVAGMESGVLQAAVGNGFICARKNTGSVYCWGLDYYTSWSGSSFVTNDVPVLVSGVSGPKDLQANGGRACVITGSGEAACWGFGPLGDGDTALSESPVLVQDLNHVVSISLGEEHSCAITKAYDSEPAKLWCWGDNRHGQIGLNPLTSTTSHTPVEVGGLSGEPVAVAAGGGHTCAIVQGSAEPFVMCWGRNDEGQLGIGTVVDTYIPTSLPNTEGAAEIAAGKLHTTLRLSNGSVKSWGGNSEGQLGNGFFFRRQLPIHLNQITTGLKDVVSGEKHTCALTTEGGVYCWGGNNYGQLGNNSTLYSAEPVAAIGLASGVTALTAGPYHTCALLDTGQAKCWGYNMGGSLGTGDFSEYLRIPKLVLLNDTPTVLSGIQTIESGGWHTCALMQNGKAKCWGSNYFGQLGDGASSPVSFVAYPVDVAFSGTFTALSGGTEHTCAVTSQGEVYCWGDNPNGELGIGSSDFNSHTLPEKVIGLEDDILDVESGGSRTCVLTTSGGVLCWGGGSIGHTPEQVYGLHSGVAAISTGGSIEYLEHHTCAIMEDTGAVKCWGYNNYAQLGDGTYSFFGDNLPVDVLGLAGNVKSVTTGTTSTCAMFESGASACWGADYRIETSPVNLIEVDNQGRPPSVFFSNYYDGAPDSYFVLTGLYFPSNRTLQIFINDELLADVLTNETGVFKFFAYFDTVGEHTIRVEAVELNGMSDAYAFSERAAPAAVGQGELTIRILEGGLQRIKEGDGLTLGRILSSHLIYLPAVRR